MSITRVNGGGWGAGDELHQAQLTEFDRRLGTLAMDKTGDTVTGTITLSGTALWDWQNTTTLQGKLRNFANTWVWDGTQGTVTFTSGTGVTISAGGTCGLGTVSTGQRCVVTTADGGRIQLADNDWPQFGSARTITKLFPFTSDVRLPSSVSATWEQRTDGLRTTSTTPPSLYVPLPAYVLHDGATLAAITFYFTPSPSGAKLPTTQPTFRFTRMAVAAGSAYPGRTSVASGSPTIASAPQYRSGTIQTYTLAMSHALDLSTYCYALQLVDESGTNSVQFTKFHGCLFQYSVNDMRFR